MSQSLPEKSLFRLALPLILSFWMRSLFSFVDTIYASTLPDADAAIAAIGLSIPFEFIYIATWVGLSTALTSYLSKAMARDDDTRIEMLNRTVRSMTNVLIPVFLMLAAGMYFVTPHLGLDPAVARNFRIYGPTMFAGMPAFGFWSVVPDSLVKAHHDTRSTMMAGIWSNLINVGLNTLFTFVLHWGIFGIGFSTVVGNLGGLTYAMWRASSLESARRARGPQAQALPPEPPLQQPIWTILRLSVPASATFLLMATEGLLINWLLSGSGSAAKPSMAAYSIYYRVVMFSFMPLQATVVALLPFTARYLGQGKVELVRSSYLQTLGWGLLYTLGLVAPAMLLGGGWIARKLGTEPQTIEFATFALRLVPLALLVSIPFLLSRPVFEGAQQGRPSIVMALLRYALLAPPLAWAGLRVAAAWQQPRFYGLMGGLMVATAVVSAVFLTWTLRFLRSLQPVVSSAAGAVAQGLARG